VTRRSTTTYYERNSNALTSSEGAADPDWPAYGHDLLRTRSANFSARLLERGQRKARECSRFAAEPI
jgi:hypothetical protein